MSTLKVNKIEATGTTDGGIEIDSDGHVQFDGVQLPTTGALSNRNIIINGAMVIGQRANLSNETTPKYGKCDRWFVNVLGASTKNYNCSQVNACKPEEGFERGLEFENINSVTPASNDGAIVSQIIEGNNLQSIRKGTTGAQPITLSFWARSSRAGTYVVDLYDADNNRQTGKSYSLEAAVWKHVVLTFPADTTGAFDLDNAASLYINWWLGAGSDFTGGSALNTSWQTNVQNVRAVGLESSFMTTAGSTFNLTGVQLEVGEKATPFEHRSIGDELARCQRYYCKSSDLDVIAGVGDTYTDSGKFFAGVANAYASNSAYTQNFYFPVEMRTKPGTIVVIPTSLVADSVQGEFTYYDASDPGWERATASIQSSTSKDVCFVIAGTWGTGSSLIYGAFTAEAELGI